MELTREYDVRRALLRSSRWDADPEADQTPDPALQPEAADDTPAEAAQPAVEAPMPAATLAGVYAYATSELGLGRPGHAQVYAITADGSTVPIRTLTLNPPE